MIFTPAERESRWARARAVLESEGLDAVLARGTAASDDGQGHYRWLTADGPLVGDSMVALTASDQALFARGGPPTQWALGCSWFDTVVSAASINESSMRDGGLVRAVTAWLEDRTIRRLGVADLATFPAGAVEAFKEALPGLELVEVGPQFLGLRRAKSSEELAIIHQGANLADEVWAAVPDLVAVGRSELEVLADIDHMLRLAGCAGSFNVIMQLGRDGTFDRQPSDRPLERGDAILLEVSPRLQGYFTQLVSVVSLGSPRDELQGAFEASVSSRSAALDLVRPGADAAEVGQRVVEAAADLGYRVSGPVFGHLLGLELEEPRVGASPFRFDQGSVFVFHPVITTDRYPFVLRGDTFLVGESGAERLSRLPDRIVEV